VGGFAREWTTELPSNAISGSAVQLQLVMTKFGGPDVQIAYEVVVEPML
jgi:hypothetical protein